MDENEKKELELKKQEPDLGMEKEDTSVDKEDNFVENETENVEEANNGVEEAADTVEEPVEGSEEPVDDHEAAEEEAVEAETEPEAVAEPETLTETEDEPETETEAVFETEEEPKKSGKGKIVAVIVVIAAVICALAYALGAGGSKGEDRGILYLKDNGLYYANAKGETELIQETVGNENRYYYSAWGADMADDESSLYYLADIDESGIGKLYYREMGSAEAEVLGEDVNNFIVADGGKACAFSVYDNGAVSLYAHKNGAVFKVADNVLYTNGGFEICQDGTFVVYKTEYDEGVALYIAETVEGAEPVMLTENVVLDMPKQAGGGYFLEQTDNSYALYSYALGTEPELISDGVTYAELMPNGNDVLFCAMQDEDTPFTTLIEDDVTDMSAYDAQKQAAILDIRERMENEKSMDPIFQDCYIVADGNVTKLHEKVTSGIAAVQNDSGFLVGYYMNDPVPAKLSEINSFEEALYAYYTELLYGEKNVFLADSQGNSYTLEDANAMPQYAVVSLDGKQAAYYSLNTITGTNDLSYVPLDDPENYVKIKENVDQMSYLGDTQILVYLYNYEDGIGTMGVYDGGSTADVDEQTTSLHFADDDNAVYYISDPDGQTGNGTLNKYDGKTVTALDENVFSFQYLGGGNIAYVKNYDLTTGIGDLGYYNGKEAVEVDTGISAIYMY